MFSVIPIVFWNETFWLSYVMCLLRICTLYNATWLVNSVAHMFGNKPYDKSINPAENWMVAFIAMGKKVCHTLVL